MSELTKGQKISLKKMGHTVSPEQRAKQSMALKGRIPSPEEKINQAKGASKFKGIKRSPEVCANVRAGMLRAGVRPSPQCIEAGHKARLAYHPTPEQAEKKRLANIGKHSAPKSEETKVKIRETCKSRKWKPEHIEARRQGLKRKWASLTPEQRNSWIKSAMRGCARLPNKPEVIVRDMLMAIAPNEWQYVGDGAVIIGGCNPDFINVNGRKLIIEVFGNYWHGIKARYNSTPDARQAIFGEYGYKTLIIWESEVKDSQVLESKIRQFILAHGNHEPSKEGLPLGRVQRLETGHPISEDDGIVHPFTKV